MAILLKSALHKARKEYSDDGYETILNLIDSNSDIKELGLEAALSKKNLPHRILPGDMYIRQFSVDGGDSWEFKTKKIFYDIIIKYDLFEDN